MRKPVEIKPFPALLHHHILYADSRELPMSKQSRKCAQRKASHSCSKKSSCKGFAMLGVLEKYSSCQLCCNVEPRPNFQPLAALKSLSRSILQELSISNIRSERDLCQLALLTGLTKLTISLSDILCGDSSSSKKILHRLPRVHLKGLEVRLHACIHWMILLIFPVKTCTPFDCTKLHVTVDARLSLCD